MQILWLGSKRQCGAIVLVSFSMIGLGVRKIRRFELVGLGEGLHWS